MRWHPFLLAGLLIPLAFPITAQARPGVPVKCGTQNDLLVRSDPGLAPVRPTDCSTVHQTPPEFTWPPQGNLGDKFTYTLTLTFPDGHHETRTTARNWLAWDRALPPGEYTWTVDAMPNQERGQPRRFTIAAGAPHLRLAAGDSLLEPLPPAP